MSQKGPGGVIAEVSPGSIADELGLVPGDRIWAIDGKPLADLIDYKDRMAGDSPVVHVSRADGEEWEVEIEKDPDEDLGVVFTSVAFDTLRHCQNRCVFCFVDQMPPGLRPTLYVKDDDYRLSFCQGSYISLTNLSDADFERIVHMRLSPLYVSVHATDPAVRQRLLGNPRAGQLMPALTRLTEARIEIHAQVVVVPGINDGAVLGRTLDDLASLHPSLASVAVVPVGLSRHRDRLSPLAAVSGPTARAIVRLVTERQAEFRQRLGTRLAFLADEFYWLAGMDIPPSQAYEHFSQLEDGVGLTRTFWDDAVDTLDTLEVPRKAARRNPRERFLLVTGVSGARVLQPVAMALAARCATTAVLPVHNDFLGREITVSGLLCGQDVGPAIRRFLEVSARAGVPRTEWTVILPDVMFRTGNGKTLDNCEPADIARLAAITALEVIPASGDALVSRICSNVSTRRDAS